MSSIAAGTTTTTGYVVTSDSTGALVLKTGASATTALTIDTSQNVTFVGSQTLSAGTANGVLYLNGSKAATSGSALTFDGTSVFSITNADSRFVGGTSAGRLIISNSSTSTYIGVYGASHATLPNILSFVTNAVNTMTMDASGNLGLGVTPSAWASGTKAFQFGSSGAVWERSSDNLVVLTSNSYFDGSVDRYIKSGFASRVYQLNGSFNWESAGSGSAGATVSLSRLMTLDSVGRLGINTSSPGQRLDVNGNIRSRDGAIVLSIGTAQQGVFCTYNQIFGSGSDYTPTIFSETGLGITFAVNGFATKAMTLDSSGNLLVGTTSSAIDSSPGFKFAASSTQPNMGIVVNSTASTGLSNYHHYNTNATNNGYRFYIVNNGGIYNFSANNSNLSDRRQKKNIEPASAYLAKMMAIPVVTFDYIDQAEDDPGKTLGVIAQEVESVAPELVNNKGFGKTPEDGVPLKSIYQTDFQYALLKCIQEQQALIETLTQRITALEGR